MPMSLTSHPHTKSAHAFVSAVRTCNGSEKFHFKHLAGTEVFYPEYLGVDPPQLTIEAATVGELLNFFITFDSRFDLVLHGNGFELFTGNTKVMDSLFISRNGIRVIFASEVENYSNLPASVLGLTAELRKNTALLIVEPTESPISIKFDTQTFSYTDRNLLSSGESWRRYARDVGINYLFSPATTDIGKNFLVVGFSAVNKKGIFGYNYRKTTDPTGANAIYLLDDFGDQGSYYLMQDNRTYIYETVQLLIKHMAYELNVPLSNIVFIGSSKGGSAALVHGLGIGSGHVYVGAPQTKIGNFLSKAHPNILRYMTGGLDQNHIDQLNNYIYEKYSNSYSSPNMTIVVGKSDHHYQGHAIPLKEHLSGSTHTCHVDLIDGTPHSEIGKAYREKLINFLANLIK